MTKLLACVFIMLSALVFGTELSKTEKKKLALVAGICKALEMMHGELSARPAMMAELCADISEKTVGEIRLFFESVTESLTSLGEISFSDIWSNALRNSFLILDKQQLETLESLGALMGSYQLSDQLCAINNCKTELENDLRNLKERYENSKKLFLGIPCSLAAMLLVILI